MLTLCNNPYIALSFGKDSIVMMDLIYSIAPEIQCLFLTSQESFLMHNFEDLINHYKISHKLNLKIIYGDELESTNTIDEARKKRKSNWYSDDFLSKDGVFMGLRIEESKARKMTLLNKENNKIFKRIMQYKNGERNGQYRCCPVADWSAFEIMHYCEINNLPLLEVYRFGEQIRTSARLPREEHRQSALASIKMSNPENYNKLLTLLPELRYV
jgi:3'-phosphoadenosine 5'-phosphosulfate sulfotransferase (PAPS reductase)/FAD synthetase